VIRISEHFPQSQQEVWDALVDPARLSDWLGGPSSIEPRVGGAVRLTIPDDGVVATGEVRACSPPRPGMSVAHLEHTFVDEARPGTPPTVCSWSVVHDERRPGDGCDLHLTMDDPADGGPGRALGDRLRADRPPTPLAEAEEALRSAGSVLLVDWIGPEVPSVVSRVVPVVYGKVGPADDDWARVEPSSNDAGFEAVRGPRPDHVDLVHLDWTLGFEHFLAEAVAMGAATFWYHSARTRPPAPADDRGCWVPPRQSAEQRAKVEAAGLRYVDDHYLADVARRLLPV
jgi:uncharacterized protein YndB with AHSA1/START domain